MTSTNARVTFDTSLPKLAHRILGMRSSAVRDLFAAATRSDIISLSGGMPDVSLLPEKNIKRAVSATWGESARVALQYGSTDGRVETKQVCINLMRDIGIRAKQENVLLTSGAQEALDLLGKTFIDPGDVIITEGPTYLGALQAFSAYEPRVETVAFDECGMRMDLLEEKLEELKKQNITPKFLYTIPNFQNPGGVTLTSERRRRLIELSHQYDFFIVEDDPYGRLRYDGGHVLPLKALDDQVIYLGTISKVFAPGLRLGWMCAPAAFLSHINLAKQGTDLCGSAFAQVVVEHYFNDTPWQKVLQGFVTTYKERRDAMLAALEKYFPPEAEYTHPEGGFFVWVTMPQFFDTDSLLSVALDAGVTYTPGSGFYPGGSEGKNCMRLAFCYESPENIEEAIKRLAAVLEERLELYRAFIDAGAIDVK